MKNKLIIILLTLVLVLAGCTMFRQPDPGGQPEQPYNQGQPQPPNNQGQFPQSDNPGQPGANQGNLPGDQIATAISTRTMEIDGVRNAVAIVLGNLAMIGVEIRDGVERTQVLESVARETERNFPQIETALVTDEVDVVDSISATSEKISQGQPTSEIMDDLFSIWQRITPE